MDGYTATIQIRGIEKEQNRPPTPIIALTANAMERFVNGVPCLIRSEKDKCKVVGMNDFLTKPIELNVLKQKLLAVIQCERKSPT